MSKDLLDDRYGRFRELPLGLARRGADVRGLCLSYRSKGSSILDDVEADAAVRWQSLDLPRLLQPGEGGYRGTLRRLARDFQPDVVWACSDVPHAALGVWASRLAGCRLVVDLYDNFEGYPLGRVPGVNRLLRRCIAAADGVSCVSEPLKQRVEVDYGFSCPVAIVGNAVPAGAFRPAPQAAARAAFDLPSNRRLIGTAGALSLARGTDLLLRAFARLAEERADVDLVLAGPLDQRLSVPDSPRVHYLGLLPAKRVPDLLPALDVSVICNRDSAFGRFCFPQKLYESLACALPVVVAAVGAMRPLLADQPGCLYEPGDEGSLLAALRQQLDSPWVPPLPIPDWDSESAALAGLLGTP